MSKVRKSSSEDYETYKRCTIYGVYDVRLGESKHLHRFVGKNFLYTAVVAFRLYGMTLLGVKRGGNDPNVRLNPGLKHVLEAGDTCYYMWHTREEYTSISPAKVAAPEDLNYALKQTSANVAMIAFAMSGINPAELGRRTSLEDTPRVEGDGWDVAAAAAAANETATPSEQGKDAPHGPELQRQRGLQLFRYHSNIDRSANPVVKVHLRSDSNGGEDASQHSTAEGECPVPRPHFGGADNVGGGMHDSPNDFVWVEMEPRQSGHLVTTTADHHHSHTSTGNGHSV